MNVLWHTHEEESPADGTIAVIAVSTSDKEEDAYVLSSVYVWDAGDREWSSLSQGNKLKYVHRTKFWWATEADLIATLPQEN